MEYVLAQNTEEDFQGFLKLEEEFDRYYADLGIGEPYTLISRLQEDYRAEFENYLKTDRFFIFAKNEDEYTGYIAGSIAEMPRSYQPRRIGHLDSFFVTEKYRRQGISTKMKDLFFEWLKSKNISLCGLNVKPKNIEAINIYKRWGFETEALRLWKKI